MQILQLETKEKIYMKDDCIQYVDPPETMFGYTYFALMIPPIRPENVLILGYGNGTIAKLIKMVWGNDVEVTGVDVDRNLREYVFTDVFIRDDAYSFMSNNVLVGNKYDYIVVDLYDGDNVSDFVFKKEFIEGMSKVCTERFSINILDSDFEKLVCVEGKHIYSKYFDLEFVKEIPRQKVFFFKRK